MSDNNKSQDLTSIELSTSSNKLANPSLNSSPEITGVDTILHGGIDDATKCPCIGSILIAGVIATEQTIAHWKEIGVKDSKLITSKKKLNELAAIIKETAVGFHIQKLTPEMIDNKCMNLNEWEMITVLNIAKKLQRIANKHTSIIEKIYVDNWEVNQKLFKTRLKNVINQLFITTKNHKNNSNELVDQILLQTIQKHKIKLPKTLQRLPFIAEHRADENYTIVGAASILAKTTSDAEYKQLKKKYGNFGSGSPGDPKTRLFVWKHRENPPPLIRKSWNTFKTLSVLSSIDDDPLKEILQNKRRGGRKPKNTVPETIQKIEPNI